MNMNGRIYMILAVLLCSSGSVLAQTTTAAAPHIPLQKTIGQAGPEVEPSMIVMNARGASLQAGKLTLIGVAPNSIVFADRPVRAAGHGFTTYLLEEWAPDGTFAKDPPNATVSVFSKDGSSVKDAVVVLKNPKAEGDRLAFDVDVLEGDLAGADGPASLFIDRFGFAYGGARGGFARVGVGRVGYGRFAVGGVGVGVARGGAWYRGGAVGAAALGAAAVGTAAAYGAYAAPACGYYDPYPPCF